MPRNGSEHSPLSAGWSFDCDCDLPVGEVSELTRFASESEITDDASVAG